MRKLDPTFGWQLSGGPRRHRSYLLVIKLCNNWSIKNIWEQQTLCCDMFGQVKASLLVSNPRR